MPATPHDQPPLLPSRARLTVAAHNCIVPARADDGLPETYHVEADLDDPGGGPAGAGGTALFRDTAGAVYASVPDTGVDDPPPANRDELEALAARLGRDYRDWRSVAYDRNYAGVVAPEPTGLDDLVAFTYREGDVSTRLVTAPPGGEPEQFNHMATGDCPDCVGAYGPVASNGTSSVVLRRYRLCREGGRLVRLADGSDTLATCCPHPGCVGKRGCLHVLESGTSSGAAGLAASITFTDPSTPGSHVVVSGQTDSSGDFCADPPSGSGSPPALGSPIFATVVSPLGAELSVPIQLNPSTGNCEANFTFCRTVVVAYAYDGDAGDSGPAAGLAATLGSVPGHAAGDQVADGSVVAASGTGVVNDGTSVTFTEETLSSDDPGGGTASAGRVPTYVAAYASGYYGHSNCCFNCVTCGHTTVLPVVLWSSSKYVWNPACDPRCFAGIAGQNGRLLVTPRKLYTTWVAPDPIVGADSGATVEVDWVPGSWDGRDDHPLSTLGGPAREIRWQSACSASGSYGGCYDSSTNNCIRDDPPASYVDPVLLHGVPFGSRRVTLSVAYTDTGGYLARPSLAYSNYWGAGCPDADPAPECSRTPVDGGPDVVITASTSGYCPWTQAGHFGRDCPPYATHPPPSGPQLFYPQGLAFPLDTLLCHEVVAASASADVPAFFPSCDWSYSVTISE